MKPYFHFKVIKAFMEQIYKEAIMQSNLNNDGEELHFDELWFINSANEAEEKTVPSEFRDCVLATKGTEKYIVPIMFLSELPFKVKSTLPCYLKKADRKLWRLITGVESILLPPNNDVVIRDFTDWWNTIEHTNQKTWTFNKFITLCTEHMGIKICECSEPAGGKGSNPTIVAEIKRNLLITSTPTIAKAEHALYYNQTIVFNEMGKPKAEEMHAIQDFFIWLADQSVRYNKRSMAIKRELGSIDITHKSVIHTYNRKQDLKAGQMVWDEIFPNPGALRNRYPQFLVEGHVTEVVSDLSDFKAQELAREHKDEIKKAISGLMGLKVAVGKQQHNYERNLLMHHSKECKWGFTPRQLTNVQGLLEYIDAYCKDQDEYDSWLIFLNNAKMAYEKMLAQEVIDETPVAKKMDLGKLTAFEGDVI
jgi:hypothetical protein